MALSLLNSIEKRLCLILKTELALSSSQVWIYNEEFVIPNTTGLYVVVQEVFSKVVSNNNYFTDDLLSTGILEKQVAVKHGTFKISLFSKNKDAQERNYEVILALKSIFSQQIQEKYSFKIFRIPSSFVSLPYKEGGQMMYRYDIDIIVSYFKEKEKVPGTDEQPGYFESFSVQVDDDKSIETDTPIAEIDYQI